MKFQLSSSAVERLDTIAKRDGTTRNKALSKFLGPIVEYMSTEPDYQPQRHVTQSDPSVVILPPKILQPVDETEQPVKRRRGKRGGKKHKNRNKK